MSRTVMRLVLASGLCLIGAIPVAAVPPAHARQESAGDEFAKGNYAFALDLYRQVRSNDENLFFSPFSISEALAMAWAGARGETASQIATTLHLSPVGEPHEAFRKEEGRLRAIQARGKAELEVANSLWPQAGVALLPQYLASLKTNYGAEPTTVDYRKNPETARATINRWVESRTRDRIRELLPAGSLDPSCQLALVNAIYFKGKWKEQFDKAATKNEPFHVSSRRTVSASLMRGSLKAGYIEVEGAQVLELPYEEEDLSLVVILPRKVDGLEEIEARLKVDDLTAWLSSTSRSRREVEVWLPRFRMDSAFRLKADLRALGLKDAFDPKKANFEGMNGRRDLFIGEGFHKAFVDVNEEGAEAAAATALVLRVVPSVVSDPPPQPVFRADHPFLFLIRDRSTQAVLFLGRIVDPTR